MLDKMNIILSYLVLVVDFYLYRFLCSWGLEINNTSALSGGGFA